MDPGPDEEPLRARHHHARPAVEVDDDRANAIRERLRRSCDRVLVYAYGDWLADTDLAHLVGRAGMSVSSSGNEPVALAGIAGAQPEGILQ